MSRLVIFASAALVLTASCGKPSRPVSPHDTLTAANLTVTYGRPYKKGRVIFGSLEPYGKVYRCGADEATNITLATDAHVAGKPVRAGTYALFVIPYEDKWTVILNGEPKQWGAFDYEKYKSKDVLQADLPVRKPAAPVEQLTMRTEGTNLVIEWDTVQVTIPISYP